MTRFTPKRAQIRKQYRIWRTAAELTQLDTALKAGLARERYWRIENAYDVPTDTERDALARVFKVSPDAISEQVL